MNHSGSLVSRVPATALAGMVIAVLLAEMAGHLPGTRAEQLPIRTYSTIEGLPRNNINRIVPDSHGFIWVCTTEGIARFDGYRFVTFGADLPHAKRILDMIETSTGEYWLATSGGLVRFDPEGGKRAAGMFIVHPIPGGNTGTAVTAFYEDSSGALWVGTAIGLFRMRRDGGSITLEPTLMVDPRSEQYQVRSLLVDRQGIAWIGLSAGQVARLHPDGRIERFGRAQGMPDLEVSKLIEDRHGRVWAGTGRGLIEFVPRPASGISVVRRAFTRVEGLPGSWVRDIWEAPDGNLWLATDRGLAILQNPSDDRSSSVVSYTLDNGLTDYYLKCIVGSRYGNIWIGTANAGVVRLMRNGFTTFGNHDGFVAVVSIFGDRDGSPLFAGYAKGPIDSSEKITVNTPFYHWRLGREEKGIFQWIRPNMAQKAWFPGGWNQLVLRDIEGDWWVPSEAGIYRFPASTRFDDIGRAAPRKVYDRRAGLTSENISRLFEDSRGDIWIGEAPSPCHSLDRWNRATDRIEHVFPCGSTVLGNFQVLSFAEDRAGAIWVGLGTNNATGALLRLRRNNNSDSLSDFTTDLFASDQNSPGGNIVDLLVDSRGRLWIASTTRGAILVEDPISPKPTFKFDIARRPLRSSRVTSLAEDLDGWIYFGTGRGVERLNPATGSIQAFTREAGLALGSIDDIYRDRQGDLWFATSLGLSRYTPSPTETASPIPVFIDSVRVRGARLPLSAIGETEVRLPALSSSDDPVEVEYVGLSFAAGDVLRYQTMLEPVESDWQDRGDQRTVNYVNISPGNYRFRVRAINSGGEISQTSASLSFAVIPPFWQRWWFYLAIATSLVAFGGLVQNYRSRQALRLARLRSHISNDLHDDVGSSLSRIAILSEVVRRRLQRQTGQISSEDDATLERVASISREAVDSLNEIVWVVNPSRDQLTDLVQRMRRFASDTLTAMDISLRFEAPDDELNLKLNLQVRRQIFFIFKEIINNIVRHSHASLVGITISVANETITLRVSDNGCGFLTTDQPRPLSGQGIPGMQQRAASIHASLTISSTPKAGTVVSLLVPRRRKRLFYYMNR